MIAILSDIHGNLEALESVMSYCLDKSVDQFIFLGDLIDYGSDSIEVVKLVSSLSHVKWCIRGNHDDAILKQDCSRFTTEHGKRNFEITLNEFKSDEKSLKLLSEMTKFLQMRFYRSGLLVTTIHGSEEDFLWGKSPKVIPASKNKKIFLSDEYKNLVLGGHSHISGYCKTSPNSAYINPGSVGQPRNGDPRAQFIICNDNFTIFEFCAIDYDIDKAAKKIYESGRPKFLSTRLYLGI